MIHCSEDEDQSESSTWGKYRWNSYSFQSCISQQPKMERFRSRRRGECGIRMKESFHHCALKSKRTVGPVLEANSLIFSSFFFFFLAKSTLKIQTWKQMVPLGNQLLLLYWAQFFSGYPIVYIHKFYKSSCTQTLARYCKEKGVDKKQQVGRKGSLNHLPWN